MSNLINQIALTFLNKKISLQRDLKFAMSDSNGIRCLVGRTAPYPVKPDNFLGFLS